ncbi:hypothetical protein CCMA1212_006101 [Trichoderma ghanense]|uniref:Uncharacterized protein n=1 Tax=Trichoderma ghanense TaxID=65468 RepID=A0ABY2H3W0_9HYPO
MYYTMNSDNLKSISPRPARSSSPPPPLLPPRPRGPELRRASRAAGAAIFGDSDGDGEGHENDDLPPSYEAATIPSDAHIHITVRSSTHHPMNSTSSLPSLIAARSGRTSINTQGYLLTSPMTPHHTSTNSRRKKNRGYRDERSGCIASDSGGCCFSRRGGCFFSDRGGCCFSDREGCCCSDRGGCCFASEGGACCADGGEACCCSRLGRGGGGGRGEMAGLETTMERNVRFA